MFKTSITSLIAGAFLFGFISYGYGFISHKFKLFPYEIMVNVKAGAKALYTMFQLESSGSRSANLYDVPHSKGGVTKFDAQLAEPGHTFMTMFVDGQFNAVVVSAEGKELHKWTTPFDDPSHLQDVESGLSLSAKNKMIHGAHLYPNGDILYVIENTGIYKINKESKVLWSGPRGTHHAIFVDDDETIWTLGAAKVEDPAKALPNIKVPYRDDTIIHLSSDGQVIEEFSILEAISKAKYEGILYGGPPWMPAIDHHDPLHANDIDIVSEEQAKVLTGVSKGDIMVSLRTNNAIVIIDRKTHLAKWSMVGPFLRQHDPDFDSDNNLVIFDNRTAEGQRNGGKYMTDPQAFGYSRILKMDPATREVLWEYSGTKDAPFYTSIMGKLQPLANGNILAVESEGGRVIEIHPETNKIAWEYINLQEPHIAGRVSQAERLNADFFPFLK